ncbi:MAG: hypothetical protein D3916_00040 [Candidatus Electrothrix sp. MAN1_4]|nr:hypothetical protein [Candidatus Electrothrix sp. MAN1_4]
MYNIKLLHNVFRSRCYAFVPAVFIITFLLAAVPTQVSAQPNGKNIHGIVKETPGIGWPHGIWIVDDKRVKFTEQTVIKGDKSKAHFGAKIVARGSHIDGVFTAYEIEVITDDAPTFVSN